MAHVLGPQRCIALPFVHAFSGCDTVSDEVTPAFCALAARPDPNSIDEHLQLLERFVVLVYDCTCTDIRVNEARKHLFSQKGRSMNHLPPTQGALVEHVKREAYQAGHIWAQMLVAVPKLPYPSEWGWEQNTNGGWEVQWTELPQASQACYELIRCSCKKGCRSRCKCVKAALATMYSFVPVWRTV